MAFKNTAGLKGKYSKYWSPYSVTRFFTGLFIFFIQFAFKYLNSWSKLHLSEKLQNQLFYGDNDA